MDERPHFEPPELSHLTPCLVEVPWRERGRRPGKVETRSPRPSRRNPLSIDESRVNDYGGFDTAIHL